MAIYLLPFQRVFDFDRLKSITSGYASFDYEFEQYKEDIKGSDIVNSNQSMPCLLFATVRKLQ